MPSSTPKVVLVVTGQGDLSSDPVIAAIGDLGGHAVRVDPASAPLHMDCELRDGRWHGTLTAGGGHTARLQDVVSVLWRIPGNPPGHPAITNPADRTWAAREDREAVFGMLRALSDVYWMSHPGRLADADRKPVQLRDAAMVGLTVPDTLITTSGRVVAGRKPPLIGKSFRADVPASANREARMVLTRELDPAALPDDLLTPVIVQPKVDGTPVRVSIIGTRLYGTAIPYGRGVDWRLDQQHLDMHPTPVPGRIADRLLRLMRQWGLTRGEADFIIRDGDSEWVFLEVNPVGTHGIFEAATGVPLSRIIAETLLARGNPCPS